MNWLLITTCPRRPDTLGSNPGDEFARLGIELLVREVDPEAVMVPFDKEVPSSWDEPREFDRAIVCGMPMLWSNTDQTCSDIWWWDYLWNSYFTEEPKRLMCLGIGHVLVGPPADAGRYHQAIEQVDRRSWGVVVREPVYGAPANWTQSICPSAYCMRVRPHAHTRRLCNLMDGGGHFGYLTAAGERWDKEQAQPISDVLLASGFTFVAHTHNELALAQKLGWPIERVRIFSTARDYLDLYAKADCFFGNRMHAAAVCAATGAAVWGVTHDSRLGMVERLGGKATKPEGLTAEVVKAWIESQKTPSVPAEGFAVDDHWAKMISLLRKFMATS